MALLLALAPTPAKAGTCELVGVTPFEAPSLSHDGTLAAFSTNAALVANDTNRTLDVYVQDLASGAVTRVSREGRSSAPSMSADGRLVAFQSDADVYLFDRVRDATTLLARTAARPSISPNGRYVAFQSTAANFGPEDKNAFVDVYVRDLLNRTTVRVSKPLRGEAVNLGSYAPSISNTGIVAFETTEDFGQWFQSLSPKATLRDGIYYDRNIVIRSLDNKLTRLVSAPIGEHAQDGLAYRPAISADGNTIAFESTSTNLVASDDNNTPGVRSLMEPDVFVLDRRANRISRVSVATDGTEASGKGSSGATISANGQRVAFESDAHTLDGGDTNGALDVFVRDRVRAVTTRASVDAAGKDPGSAGPLRFGSVSPALSGDGGSVAFATSAPGLIGASGPNAVFGVMARTATGLRGPFGIGCRQAQAGAAHTIVPWADPGSNTALRVVVLLGAGAWLLQSRRRRVALVAGALAFALVGSGPAEAHHYMPVQPGAPILHENPNTASLNFVFRDRADGTLYIATAAHNVREFAIGEKVPLSGLGKRVTLVYSREGESFSLTDFALLRVDRDMYDRVDAAVRTWGGPTGVADPFKVTAGTPTLQYGQAAFMRHTQITRAKRGAFEFSYGDRWGWIGWYLHSIPFYGGDSGSPILVGTDGAALGISIATAAGFGEPGTTSGPTVALMLQEMRLVGFDVDLVTAPFHGVVGDRRTVAHCLNEPIERGPQNTGCLRFKPGP